MPAKHVLNFMSQIMNNVRATVYQIAIPYDFKAAI